MGPVNRQRCHQHNAKISFQCICRTPAWRERGRQQHDQHERAQEELRGDGLSARFHLHQQREHYFYDKGKGRAEAGEED